MSSAIHKAHLSWVRPPVERAIGRAQVALDAYFEKIAVVKRPPSGVQQSWIDNQRKDAEQKLATVIREIEMIHSAIVAVNSPGGAALTNEMNVVCHNIIDERLDADEREKALLALMTGIVSLPSYIGMVIAGAPDTPAILARPINEIREVRGVPLLVDETVMPGLAFSYTDSPVKDVTVDPAHRSRIFDSAARPFQSAFGNWIGTQSKDSLLEMKRILIELQIVTKLTEVSCYWWVTEALIDLLLAGGLRHNNNTVTQLRTVSVAIQKASIGGEESAAEALGNDRFKNLLYVISMSKLQTDDSTMIMSRFNVTSGVDSESLKALQEKLDRSSSTTIDAVRSEVETLLSQAMVSLGRAVTASSEDVFAAQSACFQSAIRDIASIFFMINDDELSSVAKTAASRLPEGTRLGELTDAMVEDLKSDLLYLDARLKNLTENVATKALGIEGVAADVVNDVVSESLKVIVSVRRSIALHVDSGEAKEDLEAGLEELLNVAQVTTFTGALKIGAILRGVARTMIAMVEQNTLKEGEQYDNAARALVATEIYLESIHSGFDPDPQLLDHACTALESNHVDVGVVAVPSRSELMSLFDTASAEVAEDEDTLLPEMSELRPVFEEFAGRPDFTDLHRLEVLYQAADRIAQSGLIAQVESIHRLGSALSAFAKDIYSIARDESFDLNAMSALVKDACALMIRCFDEYSAKGSAMIFVVEVAAKLLDAIAVNEAVEQTDTESERATQMAHEQDDEILVVEAAEVILAHEAGEEETSYPDGVDSYMIELYRGEYKVNHDSLMGSLSSGSTSIDEFMCRTVHTMRGCSGSANCMPLNRVFAALENRLRDLAANDVQLSAEDAHHLIEMLDECMVFHLAFPWQDSTNLEDAWIEMAKAVGTGAVESAYFEEVVREEITACPEETNAQHSAEQLTHQDVVADSATDLMGAIASPAVGTVVDTVTDAPGEIGSPDGVVDAPSSLPVEPEVLSGYDTELASFYIEEADERLPQLQDNFVAWLGDLGNRELIHTIKRQMHTLKGAAAMAALSSIQDVTHLMESLFESLSLNIIPADQACIELVEVVLQEIAALTTSVRANRGLRSPTGLIRCLRAAVEKNRIDLTLLSDQPFSAETPADSQTASPQPDQGQAGPGTEVDEESSHCEKSDLSQDLAEGESAAADANSANGEGSGHKKTRRRSRGKGAAKRHQERMEHEAAAKLAARDSLNQGASKKTDQAIHDDRLAAEATHNTTAELQSIERENLVAGVESSQVNPASPDTSAQSEMPAPVIQLVEVTPPEAPMEEATRVSPARRLPFDEENDEALKPVVSNAVRMLLDRTQQKNRMTLDAQRSISTEKIKVDQRLLETAVVQASELTASRHRQMSLHKEATIGLTAVREKMEALALQQNQFIQILRSYINQPNGLSATHTTSDQMQLERFNDISSMAVHSAAHIMQIIQDLQFMEETGEVMEDAIRNQGRLISSLQRDLIHSRLVPFNNIKPALTSTIDQTSKVLKKKVKPQFIGGETILDKMILDAIKDPLFHILRNAIDHGLESSDARIAAGKSPEGSIVIRVYRRAKNMVVTISDDGRGIDPTAVRAKALAIGLIRASDDLSEKEIIRLITHNGFSTASSVGHISGRGVGMDIVAAAVESMGGMLLIESVLGKGTTFSLELPFSIGSNRAMVCSTGGQWFAIPTFTMKHVTACPRSVIEDQRAQLGYAVIEHEGDTYQVISLSDLIAMPDLRIENDQRKNATLLLCKHGSTCVAIEVEKAESMPEIHIRELDGILRNVRGVIGETELSDGTAIFVLDVMELVRLNLKHNGNAYTVRQNRIRAARRDSKPLAFVVDDATSYRRQLTQYFESRGFEVITARDGQDAIDMLPLERMPAIISVDLEMPRVDGLVLTKRLRAMPELDNIPIMMLTSRTGLEEQASAAGVNVYKHKPCDWTSLDAAVRSMRPDLFNTEAAA
jgi:chemotaxis protein histidine kinase CheA/CheY-like chemotaxis protein